MTRTTSSAIYRQIKENGMLNVLQLIVYDNLCECGPMTQAECSARMCQPKPSVSPRFAELEKLGAIHSVGKRPCRITGYTCLIWDVTDKLPVKVKKEDKIDPDVPVCPKCQLRKWMSAGPRQLMLDAVWTCSACAMSWDDHYLKGWNDGWKAKRK